METVRQQIRQFKQDQGVDKVGAWLLEREEACVEGVVLDRPLASQAHSLLLCATLICCLPPPAALARSSCYGPPTPSGTAR